MTSSTIIGFGRRLLLAYAALSIAVAIWMVALIMHDGAAGFYYLQGPADPAATALKFATFLTAWAMTGGLLALTQAPAFARRHGAFLFVLTLILFEYLILLREPHPVREGDFSAYFDAAVSMRTGAPINQNVPRLYLYPPLLATLLEPLVPLGLMPALGAFKFGSQAALGLVLICLYPILQRTRYTKEGASLALLAAFAANAPLHHNFVYSQVNLFVLLCMVASLLAYPRFRAWSAIALAVGAHLKVYPLMLALPFLLVRDWKWLFWFGGAALTLVVATSLANDVGYYSAFLRAVSTLRETGLRTSAVDSLVYNTIRLSGLDLPWLEKPLANALRLLAGGWAVWACYRFMTSRSPGEMSDPQRIVTRGFAALPLAMLLVSPSVWPHHFVLLIPSLLMLLPLVKSGGDLLLYGVSYLLIFLFPVNEIYPFSYLRLAALLVLVVLVRRLTRYSGTGPEDWFASLQRRWSADGAAAESRG